MRTTMKGFLLAECNRLAGLEKRTTSLKKLYRAADVPAGARSREYVFLYALETGKLDALLRLAERDEGSPFAGQCRQFAALAASFESDAEGFLAEYGNVLGKRFSQVLDAFRAPEARKKNDLHVKALMRGKVLDALRAAGATPYEMICDLGLNKGNAYAYLRGDGSKVSRATARRMYDYATARLREGEA